MLLKSGFTMVELIFVVVILGILSAVALPRMGSLLDIFEEGADVQNVHALRSELIRLQNTCILRGTHEDIIESLDLQAHCCCPKFHESSSDIGIDTVLKQMDIEDPIGLYQKFQLLDPSGNTARFIYDESNGAIEIRD
jgi:prepilin-type N-terminal cleavage/methylation domain-containing protein